MACTRTSKQNTYRAANFCFYCKQGPQDHIGPDMECPSDETSDELRGAAEFASGVLAELYAKYQTKIGPFASQAQVANGRLRAALKGQRSRKTRMNDRIRLKQLCDSIASLTPETDSCGLSLQSLEALQRMVQSRLDASNDEQPEFIKTLRQVLAAPSTPMGSHTAAQVDAFKQGLRDRIDGRPMTAFGDARDDDEDLTDAYCCGYDPYDTLELTKPEFVEHNKREIAGYMAEIGIVFPADILPRTSCEFTAATDYDPTKDLLLLNLLNHIESTRPGFDRALADIRMALPVRIPEGMPMALDATARTAIELLIYIRDGGFLSEAIDAAMSDSTESEARNLIGKIDDFDALLKNSLR